MTTNKTIAALFAVVLLFVIPHCMLRAQDPKSLQLRSQQSNAQSGELWYGILDAKVRRFRFVLELKREDGSWTGVLTSLDEGSRKFKVDSILRDEKEFSFEIISSAGKYEGSFDESQGSISGKWKQRTANLDLQFKSVSEIPVEELESLWVGKLNVVLQKLDVAVRKLASGDVLFDSVTQKAGGFVASFKEDGDSVELEVPAIRAKFAGEYNDDRSEITGKWSQGFVSVELVLRKSDSGKVEVVAHRRPQTPQPPFPYDSSDVSFSNNEAGINLAGTLTIPHQGDKFPAVILISGSGPQDRDESIMEHKPFWVIADHLTRNGIAVLRFDDRGVGKSEGNFATATSEDFAADVEAAIQFLRGVDRIDAQQIGLCGHSEGGIIAPMVAAKDHHIAFIVLMAGTGVNGEKILISQSRLILEAEGTDQDTIERQGKMQQLFIDLAKQVPPLTASEFRKQAREAIEPYLDPDEKREEQVDQIVHAAAAQLLTPWFRFFIRHDPATALRNVRCPVLAVNGEKDLQVAPELNLPAIESALSEAKLEDFKIVRLPGLNHLFQKCKTGSVSEYQEIEQTIDPSALEVITEWIETHTR